MIVVASRAESGLKIGGAMVASFVTLALIAVSCDLIANGDGSNLVFIGWLLMCTVVLVLTTTVHLWRHWFYFLPGYVMLRTLLWVFFGWFSPRGYLFILFAFLMAAMAMLSYRFSQPKTILVTDRIALMLALACFIASIAGMLFAEPRVFALIFAGAGDLILLLQWTVVRPHYRRRHKPVESAGLSIPDH